MAGSETFHFDEFTLDLRERRLLRGTEALRLPPKAYDVLVALVQQRGHLVTKDELLTRLWPGTFVEEGSLNVCVSALRKALGEDARRPTYIETVARSGYRFIAAVRCDPAGEKAFAPSARARPVELYELVGRGRSHLLSDSFLELPAAVDAFRSGEDLHTATARAVLGREPTKQDRQLAKARPHPHHRSMPNQPKEPIVTSNVDRTLAVPRWQQRVGAWLALTMLVSALLVPLLSVEPAIVRSALLRSPIQPQVRCSSRAGSTRCRSDTNTPASSRTARSIAGAIRATSCSVPAPRAH